MSFRIISGKSGVDVSSTLESQKIIFSENGLIISASGELKNWTNALGERFYLFGNLLAIRTPGTVYAESINFDIHRNYIESYERRKNIEGKYSVIKILIDGSVEIWTDQAGGIDLYFQELDDTIIVASNMDLLPVAKQVEICFNPVSIAHAMLIYGGRPAKQHTIYSGVKRVGVDQFLRISEGELIVEAIPYTPIETLNYSKKENEKYTEIFLEALKIRASDDGNVLYLSSGWDSTAILAGLVHTIGAKKIKAVIGRQIYSERNGICNQIEIDRATAVAEYYNIPLEVCDFDYRFDAPNILEKVRPLFRSQQFSNLTGINHWLLAEHASKSGGCKTVFAGEISDGAHNLGFSQFTTIFHPYSYEFREYSDKMASYLFGPTFYKEVLDGMEDFDPVWRLFKERNSHLIFEEINRAEGALAQQYLSSFFLRSSRLPFTSLDNSKILSKKGAIAYSSEMEDLYISEKSKQLTATNLFSIYLHLYNSFHWQGSTVATLEHTAEAHGLQCALPFHDSLLIDFLSAMPESWGRGLDLKPTKYPLKWMLENKIDYPMHLQVGPHSYTYDIDPSFSHAREILCHSSFTPLFKKTLNSNFVDKYFDPTFFDIDYILKLISKFKNNENLSGSDLNDASVLAFQSAIGCYSD